MCSHLNECSGNGSRYNFSLSMQERRDSCVLPHDPDAADVSGVNDMNKVGYWRHPGYVLQGTFTSVAFLTGVLSYGQCASFCDKSRQVGCEAFQYNPDDRQCILMQGKPDRVCDPIVDSCKDDNDGKEIYVRDADKLYCGESVVECACSREYLNCMVKAGCAKDGSSSTSEYAQQCVLSGCSAKQCGLPPGTDVCNVSTPVCLNAYFKCNLESSDACACTQDLIACRAGAGCELDDRIDQVSGFNAFDLCAAEGCTAEACGLGGQADRCNHTSLVCSDHYLACQGGAQAHTEFQAEYVGGVPAEIETTVSDDGLGVTWSAIPGPPSTASGAALVSRGVHTGKVYWEIKVPGMCALVGVARPGFDIHSYPGFDDYSWGYGDIGFGGELRNNVAINFGDAIGQDDVIRVALHAEKGLVWFGKNNVWLGGGDPDLGLNPSVRLSPAFALITPVIGWFRSSKCTQSELTFRTHFAEAEFRYDRPKSFVAFRSNECSCTAAYVGCMQNASCRDEKNMQQLSQHCQANGCTPEECGLQSGMPTPWLCDTVVPVECNQRYLNCTSAPLDVVVSAPHDGSRHTRSELDIRNCRCTREKFECLAERGCQLDEAGLKDYGQLCALNKCSAQECGLCSPACNATVLQCSQTYLACSSAVKNATREEKCACAADFYSCVDRGGCIDDEIASQHSAMCADNACTAHECGLSTEFQTCNSNVTNLVCTKEFINCREKRVPKEQDRCSLNYRIKGREYCTDPARGGLEGCLYDEDTDECYTSGDCLCAKDYFGCMKDGCVDHDAVQEFADTCVEMGCTASQCGVDYFSCNRTSLTCANAYLSCEFQSKSGEEDVDNMLSIGDVDASEDPEDTEDADQPWCATSFCLRTYFRCMRDANCTSPDDLREHLQICSDMGCTPGQCGVSPLFEEMRLPDSPVRVRMTSVLGNKLVVRWSNSPLAIRWSRQGSKNILLQYVAVLEECGTVSSPLVCTRQISNVSIPFGDTNKAQWDGLTIGILYRASIWAVNVNGTSPNAAIGVERLSGPPGPPQNLQAQRRGPLLAKVDWELPLDTGDRTNTRKLVSPYYIAEVVSAPGMAAINISTESLDTAIKYYPSRGGAIESLGPTIGGSFSRCAWELSSCTCFGLVRFGTSGLWSPPVQVSGVVLCAAGRTSFPDLAPGVQKECQCNPEGQMLRAGQPLTARVLAINSVGLGNFSQVVSIRIMGQPSAVRSVSASEAAEHMTLTWTAPADTGFADATAPILSYTIYLSDCHDFASTREECRNVHFCVAQSRQQCIPKSVYLGSMAAACQTATPAPTVYTNSSDNQLETTAPFIPAAQCHVEIPAKGNFMENGIYFMKAVAQNEVGFGFLSHAPVVRQTFKLLPRIENKRDVTDLPNVLQVAEFRGSTSIWIDSINRPSVSIRLKHLPYVAPGSELQLTVRKGSDIGSTSATVQGTRVPVPPFWSPPEYSNAEAWMLQDPQGVNVLTTLTVSFPPFGTAGGSATVDIFTPAFPNKLVSVALQYFEYQKPSFIRILPKDGPLGGGSLLDIDIIEPTAKVSRYGHSPKLSNFITASEDNIQVLFNYSTPGTGLLKTTDDFGNVKLTVTSPGNDIEGWVPITLKLDGFAMTLKEAATPPRNPALPATHLRFKFRGAFVAAVQPRIGLTTGNQAAQLLIQDTGPMVLTAVTVWINDQRCTVLDLPVPAVSNGVWQMVINVMTPVFAAAEAGMTSIVISLSRSGRPDLVIRDNEKYKIERPPDPLFLDASVRVQGRVAGEIWVSRTSATLVTFAVRYFMPWPDSELEVKFDSATSGSFGATSVTYKSVGPADDIRLVSTKIECVTPINVPEGFYSIVVVASDGTKSARAESHLTDKGLQLFEFVDMSKPRIDSVSQTESRAAGGALVLVGVTGFCRGQALDCKPDFEGGVDFEMHGDQSRRAATVIGSVSLKDWLEKTQEANSLKSKCPGSRDEAGICPTSIDNFLNGLGRTYKLQIDSQFGRGGTLEKTVQSSASDGVTKDSNTFVLAIMTPATSPSMATLSVSAFGNVDSFGPFNFTAPPVGAATVTTFAEMNHEPPNPSEGVVNDVGKLVVTITNMQPIYFLSEAWILFGDSGPDLKHPKWPVMIENSKIRMSNSEMTQISIVYKFSASDTPVSRIISITPGVLDAASRVVALLEGNRGSFRLNFIDTQPKVLSFSPAEVYDSGGESLNLVVENFGAADLQPAQLTITVEIGQEQLQSPDTISLSGVTASYQESPPPPPITKTAAISFLAPAVTTEGIAKATIRYVSGSVESSVSFSFKYIAVPTEAAELSVAPRNAKSTGGEELVLSLTKMKQVTDKGLLKVSIGGTALSASQILSMQSTRLSTLVRVSSPALNTGGEKEVRVWETGREKQTASAYITYKDVNKAELSYPLTSPQGGSELTTEVKVGVKNFGITIEEPSDLSITASLSGLVVVVDSIIGSTPTSTDLVLRVPPSPSAIATETDVSIEIRPAGSSSLKMVSLIFTYLPPGQPRVDSFLPASVYEIGGVEMSILIANFPAASPQASAGDVLVVFIDGVSNVTASSLTYSGEGVRRNVEITAVVPSGTAGTVTPKVVVSSKSVSVALPSPLTYRPMPTVSLGSIVPSRGNKISKTRVRFKLENFPGPLMPSDIVISVKGAEAEVISFSQDDDSLDARAIQTIVVYAMLGPEDVAGNRLPPHRQAAGYRHLAQDVTGNR